MDLTLTVCFCVHAFVCVTVRECFCVHVAPYWTRVVGSY